MTKKTPNSTMILKGVIATSLLALLGMGALVGVRLLGEPEPAPDVQRPLGDISAPVAEPQDTAAQPVAPATVERPEAPDPESETVTVHVDDSGLGDEPAATSEPAPRSAAERPALLPEDALDQLEPVWAEKPLEGPAQVGATSDLLNVEGVDLRLYGLLAPAPGDLCLDRTGQDFDCAGWARIAAIGLLLEHDVTCRVEAAPVPGERPRAACALVPADTPPGAKGGVAVEDLAVALAREGAALPAPGANPEGRPAQAARDARDAGRGLWSGRFDFAAVDSTAVALSGGWIPPAERETPIEPVPDEPVAEPVAAPAKTTPAPRAATPAP